MSSFMKQSLLDGQHIDFVSGTGDGSNDVIHAISNLIIKTHEIY